MSIYQLPKRLHPDFSQPNKQPIGEVEIDRGNPFGRSVVSAYIPKDQGILHDISGANNGEYLAGVTSTVGEIGYQSNYSSNAAQRIEIPSSNSLQISNKITISSWVYWDVLEINQPKHIVSKWASYITRFSRKSGFVGHNFLLFDGASEYNVTVGTPVTGRWYHHVASYDGVTASLSVYDSATRTFEYGTTAHTGTIDTNTNTLNIGNYEGLDNSFDLRGSVGFVSIHNDSVTEQQARALSLDAYQILKPKTPLPYFVDQGAASNTLTADSGSYTLAGSAVSLERGLILSADSGGYTYLGTDVNLSEDLVLALDSGAYTYSGTSTDLLRGLSLDADSGAYSYSGTAATLTFTGAGSFELASESGAYTYSGSEGSLLAGRNLAADSGAYSYTGTAATLSHNMFLVADSGAYSYNGANTALTASLTLSVDSGEYAYTGTSAVMAVSGQVVFGVTMYPLIESREMILQSEKRSMIINARQ